MKFEREPWRKLYVAESAEHRLLSVFARGMRDYLLRLAGEDGTILAKTADPKSDLARLLGAEKPERALIAKAFEDLCRVGYLSYENDRLWITKFFDAQLARSPGAIRQARYKERHQLEESREEVTLPTTSPTTSPETSARASALTSARDATLTSQIEEKRREEKREGPAPTKRPWRRFPKDWPVPAEILDLAASLGLNFELEYAKICDHEFKTPKVDPAAALRNWLRGANSTLKPTSQTNLLTPERLAQINADAVAKAAAVEAKMRSMRSP